jgi:hypothetical protein
MCVLKLTEKHFTEPKRSEILFFNIFPCYNLGGIIVDALLWPKLLPAFFLNPSRTDIYFFYQNQNTKNIGNLMTLLKPHNIGTHLEGIETSFQVFYHYF